jgi:ribonuclease P protein component
LSDRPAAIRPRSLAAPMRFRTEQHLRRQRDFVAIREHGRRINCGAFTLWCLIRTPSKPRPDTESAWIPKAGLKRLGVVASTASVGNAVLRNRAKRRLREIFRLHQDVAPAGSDLLLSARTAVTTWDFIELEKKFVEACRQLAPVEKV